MKWTNANEERPNYGTPVLGHSKSLGFVVVRWFDNRSGYWMKIAPGLELSSYKLVEDLRYWTDEATAIVPGKMKKSAK